MKKDAVPRRGRRLSYGNWLLAVLLYTGSAFGQVIVSDTSAVGPYTSVAPGPQYNMSSRLQKLWGQQYRMLWTLPVQVPTLHLDTLAGGSRPYRADREGARKTLHLRTADGKEVVLRSLGKTYSNMLPPEFQNTIVADMVNDQVSGMHPYAEPALGPIARAAGIYHPGGRIYFVPVQSALDSFNREFGNGLYLAEQHPAENREGLAGPENRISTTELFARMEKDNRVRVDQQAFIRARLFDLLVGDWNQKENQWRWAAVEKEEATIYTPIHQNQEQAFSKYDGKLVKILFAVVGMGHLQPFDKGIKDVNRYQFTGRYLDRRLANETSLQDWLAVATELQQLLTDNVLEQGIRQMPAEAVLLSGSEVINTLRARREKLVDWATEYYRLLAKNVDVTGSQKSELFWVRRLQKGETEVGIYALNGEGPASKPFYRRVFKEDETEEIRLYGLGGSDRYRVEGTGESRIKIRMIGGPQQDSFVSESAAGRVHVYDNRKNTFLGREHMRRHLSNDSLVHQYQYNAFQYDKKGLGPVIFYSVEDRLYVGLAYKLLRQRFRKTPFGSRQQAFLYYSINERAFHTGYQGQFQQVLGKWNLALAADYDWVRWTNFFGVGNNTKEVVDDINYYRLRTRLFEGSAGLNRPLGKYQTISLTGFYQTVDIIKDRQRFVAKEANLHGPNLYDPHHFAGLRAAYAFTRLNDPMVPTKGLMIAANAAYTGNVKESAKSFTRYAASVNWFVPLLPNLVLASRTGAAAVTGKPEFYQLASIGGSWTLRGYRRDRFWGKTAFYNSNELQWLFNYKDYWYSGKVGLIALFDQGRVWHPGERSDAWHSAFGGGILLAPFNKIMASVTYAKSAERGRFDLRVVRKISF